MADPRAVEAVLALWRSGEGEELPEWPQLAELVVNAVEAVNPLPAPGQSPLTMLLDVLKGAPDSVERATMAQAAIARIEELRDLALKATWAQRPEGATIAHLAARTKVPIGTLSVLLFGREHPDRR